MRMRVLAWLKRRGAAWPRRRETGVVFLEVLVSLALVGIVAVAFLSGLATTSRATIVSDRQSTAVNLGRSNLDWAKQAAYVAEAASYDAIPLTAGDAAAGYSVNITAAPLNSPDDGIQKITVTVLRHGETIDSLEGYKIQ